MAQFDIDLNISDGNRLEWLALPDDGETPQEVEAAVRKEAMAKFGQAAFFNRWSHTVASNGYVVVTMYA